MALMFSENFVLPILQMTDELISLRNNGNYYIYYKIYKTLFMLNLDKELFKLKDFILSNFDQDQLHALLTEFLDYKNKFSCTLNKSKPIVEMFNYRMNQLEENLNTTLSQLQFSWIMKDGIDGHKKVNQFLRSDQQEMIYSGSEFHNGGFSSKSKAECFVHEFSGLKNRYDIRYSTKMQTVKTPRQKYHVIITKTMEYFHAVQNEHRKKFDLEISILKSYLKN